MPLPDISIINYLGKEIESGKAVNVDEFLTAQTLS